MFVVLVYDTAAERNPVVLKTCRKYLHWTQRSVFEGELSAAQYRALLAALRTHLDLDYDSIRIYRTRSPHLVETEWLGHETATRTPSSRMTIKALTCGVALPPDRCRTSPGTISKTGCDLRVYLRVPDHPWRD